jgi:hypothetical protein
MISIRGNVCLLYEGEGAVCGGCGGCGGSVWMVRGMGGVCSVVVVLRLALWLWK